MKPIFIGDQFRKEFEKQLKVAEAEVLNVLSNPLEIQSLENNYTLYLGKFENSHLSNLLVATQETKIKTIIVFAYWIPNELLNKSVPLISNLEIFANKFGLKTTIGDKTNFFIHHAKKMVDGRIKNITDLCKVEGPSSISCQTFISTNENQIGTLNWVDCYYVFTINLFKYNLWLYQIETCEIKCAPKWEGFIKEATDLLDPLGRTNLKVYSGKRKSNEDVESISILDNTTKKASITIPLKYNQLIKHIVNVVESLEENERIFIKQIIKNSSCIFCGKDEQSQEHIYAKWMRAYFDEKTLDLQMYLGEDDASILDTLKSSVSSKNESSYGYTTHNICGTCNNTWMSNLEEEVKTLMAKNDSELKSDASNITKNQDDCDVLARWSIVKLILFLFKSDIPFNGHFINIEEIRKGKIPKGFIVEITDTEIYNLEHYLSVGTIVGSGSLKLDKLNAASVKHIVNGFVTCTIQVGHILFRASYLPPNDLLRRESIIRKTKVIYPFNSNLKFTKTEFDAREWKKAEEKNISFRLFSAGLYLAEINVT